MPGQAHFRDFIALTFANSAGNAGRHIRQARQNWTSFMAYDCIRLSVR